MPMCTGEGPGDLDEEDNASTSHLHIYRCTLRQIYLRISHTFLARRQHYQSISTHIYRCTLYYIYVCIHISIYMCLHI